MFFNVQAERTIKVLAIGNSFSTNAVEHNLYELGEADNIKLIIGNLAIGGCSLSMHWYNAAKDAKLYSYLKINEYGDRTVTESRSLYEAIVDENWDYITFQQVSNLSGKYETYFPYLSNLLNYVKNIATNPNVKYAFHSTWAYAQNTAHIGFANYNNDQMTMYNAIIDASFRAAKNAGIETVLPVSTAIQNGRTSVIGNNFCIDDGYHLNNYGQYIAACTWYEVLSGNNVVGNTFEPIRYHLEESYKEIFQRVAHAAVVNPKEVTFEENMLNFPSKEYSKVKITDGLLSIYVPEAEGANLRIELIALLGKSVVLFNGKSKSCELCCPLDNQKGTILFLKIEVNNQLKEVKRLIMQ